MTLDSCSLCCVLVSGFWFLVFDLCLCIMSCVFVLIFHDPLCPLSFSCVLPSGSLCLLYCSLHVFSCAPPLCYHTWPPPSSLSSPVICLIVSVCVFSLCFPPCLGPVIIFVSPSAPAPVCLQSVPHGMCFWILSFAFCLWFELCFLVCTFTRFCFFPDLASCLTVFGSTSPFHSLPL